MTARRTRDARAPSLGLYLARTAPPAGSFPLLRKRGSLALSTRTASRAELAVTEFNDPLVPTEWWLAAVGVDTLTPPRAGRPVTIIDSGIDVTHPEFLGRANTETLNEQEPAGIGGEHGTAVASIVAAPANGVGIVGVYPRRSSARGMQQKGRAHSSRPSRSSRASLLRPTTAPA